MKRLLLIGFVMVCFAAPLSAQGSLLIVGGGLSDDNEAVFRAFIDALPSPNAPIAIVPAASSVPAESAAAAMANLQRYGIAPDRIRVVRAAMVDDPASAENEADWRDAGNNVDEVAKLGDVGGIWFTGGDQARVTAVLLAPDGRDSALLGAMRHRLRHGAVIGGTSAGAAIMSRTMLLQGSVLFRLPNIADESDAVLTGPGLGFLDHYMVDQHFGERARLGRLVEAVRTRPSAERVGFGIDEDTALLVSLGRRSAQVVGRGHVTIVDARNADFGGAGGQHVQRIMLSILSTGDRIDLASVVPSPADQRVDMTETPGSPRPLCTSAPSSGQITDSESVMISRLAASMRLGDVSTCLLSADDSGIAFRFGWTTASRRWSVIGDDAYTTATVTGLSLEIAPVRIRLSDQDTR